MKSSPSYFTLAGTQVKVQGGTGWLQHYERAVEVHPTYAPAHYNLGAQVGAAAPAAVGDWLLLRARVARLVKKKGVAAVPLKIDLLGMRRTQSLWSRWKL